MLLQALAFERLLLVVKTRPTTHQPAARPRLAELKPVNENITVNLAARQSDAQQRVPLEPLFHINTDAPAAAEPMSIDDASENHTGTAKADNLVSEAETQAPILQGAAQVLPALHGRQENGSLETAPAESTTSPISGPVRNCIAALILIWL